jgi:hypothetical protein
MYHKVIRRSILYYCLNQLRNSDRRHFTKEDIQQQIKKWTIFDVPQEDVDGVLLGLATRYPDTFSAGFTLGLNEFEVKNYAEAEEVLRQDFRENSKIYKLFKKEYEHLMTALVKSIMLEYYTKPHQQQAIKRKKAYKSLRTLSLDYGELGGIGWETIDTAIKQSESCVESDLKTYAITWAKIDERNKWLDQNLRGAN